MKEFTNRAFTVQENEENLRISSKSKTGSTNELLDEDKLIECEITNSGEVATPSEESLYFLPTFWKLMQDEAPIPSAITELATLAIKAVLSHDFCKKTRIQYLFLCLENIKNHRSAQQSISLSYYIMAIFNTKRALHGKTLLDLFKEIMKRYSLTDIILDSCIYYMKAVELNQSKIQGEIAETIFIGKYKHGPNISIRLGFLQYVLGIKGGFGIENLDKLWNLYVTNCKIEYDTQEFLKWISLERETNNNILPISSFEKEENEQLFTKICKSRELLAKNFGSLYYKCFGKMFKQINFDNKTIDIKQGRVKAINFESIIGIDAVWENLGYNHQEPVRIKFCELLIDLYLNISDNLNSKRSDILNAFIDRSMTTIIKADCEKDQIIIANNVKLLLLFLDNLDGKKYTSSETSSSQQTTYIIHVNLKKVQKKIEVPVDVKIGQLRKKVADAFNLPYGGFKMRSTVRVYEPEDDDAQLRNIGWAQLLVIEPYNIPNAENSQSAKETNNKSLKSLLAYNDKYMSHLFILLSKENTAYVDSVWELLSTLPSNQKMLTEIQALNVSSNSLVNIYIYIVK